VPVKPSGVCQTAPTKASIAENSTALDFSETGKMLLKYDGARSMDNGQCSNKAIKMCFLCYPTLPRKNTNEPNFKLKRHIFMVKNYN